MPTLVQMKPSVSGLSTRGYVMETKIVKVERMRQQQPQQQPRQQPQQQQPQQPQQQQQPRQQPQQQRNVITPTKPFVTRLRCQPRQNVNQPVKSATI